MRLRRPPEALATGLLLALALAVASPLPAPDESDPLAERSRFFGSVDVSIVNLDVVVTERDGRPVTGLGAGDFELLVDGEPVEILNFFAGAGAATPAEPAPAAPPSDAPAPPSDVPSAVPVPSSQQLWLVVYVDSTSIRGPDRIRVVNQLRELLASNLGQGDRVMVVANGGEQKILHRFGDPLDDLSGALDRVSAEVGGIGQFDRDRMAILNTMARGAAGRLDPGQPQAGAGALQLDTRLYEAETVLNDIYAWAQWRRDGLLAATSRMEALLDALAGIEGRKALLYVGEGTPYRVGESLFQAWLDRYQPMLASLRPPPTRLLTLNPHREASRYSVQREYLRLAAHAAAARVALYAVDTSQSDAAVGITAELPGVTGALANETARQLARQESLQRLVSTTGGRYLVDLDRVEEVVAGLRQDFVSSYSLGFAPPGAADGEPRSVEVRVRNPAWEVRHRSSFRATSLDERMAEQLYAALYLGVAPNPLAVRLEHLGTEPARAKGQYTVSLLARIPLSSLLLVPQADELLGRATAWLAVADHQGSMSDVHGRRLPVTVKTADLGAAMGQDVGYALEIVVGRGRQQVALVVRDELAVISSTVLLELEDGVPVAGGERPPQSST